MKKIKVTESKAGTGKPYAEGKLILEIGGKQTIVGPVQVRLRKSDEPTMSIVHIQCLDDDEVTYSSRDYGQIADFKVKTKGIFAKAMPSTCREDIEETEA